MVFQEVPDIGAFTLTGNRYGSLNQDYVASELLPSQHMLAWRRDLSYNQLLSRIQSNSHATTAPAVVAVQQQQCCRSMHLSAGRISAIRQPHRIRCRLSLPPLTPPPHPIPHMIAHAPPLQEVWSEVAQNGSSNSSSSGRAGGPLVIGAVLDGHGLLGESAARAGGTAIVRELRRLIGHGDDATSDANGTGLANQSVSSNGAADGLRTNGNGCRIGSSDRTRGCSAGSSGKSSEGESGNAAGNNRVGGAHGCGSSSNGCGVACSANGTSGVTPAAASGDAPSSGGSRSNPAAAPQLLTSIPEAALKELVDAAFQSAHASALQVYDDPPRTCCYPDAHTGAAAVYCLHSEDGLHMYKAPAGSRASSMVRPLECGATCTVALLQGRRLVVGNVGDSSAVLGRWVGLQLLCAGEWGAGGLVGRGVLGALVCCSRLVVDNVADSSMVLGWWANGLCGRGWW